MPVYAAGSLTEPPVSVPRALLAKPTVSGVLYVLGENVRPTLVRRYGHSTSTGAAAGRYALALRNRSKVRVQVVRAHAKLIEIRLARHHGAGGA